MKFVKEIDQEFHCSWNVDAIVILHEALAEPWLVEGRACETPH